MQQEITRQNELLYQYVSKYFTPEQIEQLITEYSFSEMRRLLGEIDIEFFALCYFPKYFDRAFGSFHKELFAELKYMLDNTSLIEAFGLPREHGKSTINSFLFPLYSTLYKKSQFTLIISATEQIALPFLDMIKDELENNQLLLEDFGIIKGNRWNNNEIWIRGRNALDACIMIRGIDGSLRGIHFKQYRPQLVLLDDLLKDDTAKSETKRETVKNTFTDVVIPIGTKDTNILVVGTVLHEEDLMADLLKGKIPGVRSIRKSAILSFSDRDDLWGEWERLYNNLTDPERINTAKEFFLDHQEEMLEGTTVLWNEYLDYYYLMCKKQAMGDKSFYKELQNDPRSTDEYIFQDIGYWETLPNLDSLEIVMYIDPAIKAGKRNDYSAVTILARQEQTGQIEGYGKAIIDTLTLPDDSGKPQTGISDITNARQVLAENLVPLPMRRLVIDPSAENKFLQLTTFHEADKLGDSGTALREASLGRKFGFDIYADQNVITHTKGTLAVAGGTSPKIVAKTAGTAGDTTLTLTVTGGTTPTLTGTLKKGDYMIIGTAKYLITKNATAADDEIAVEFTPGLAANLLTTTEITVGANYTANLAFHRNAFALVSRPLALPKGLGETQKAIVNYDGFGLRVIYDYNSQYKKDVVSIDMLCGVKTLDPKLACKLLG